MSTPPKSNGKSRPQESRTKPSRRSEPAGRSEQTVPSSPPLGALLRITHEALTQAIIEGLLEQGIEMTETEFSVMRYPGPDGVRPIDLAQRCNMTKQAMNYVLASFEAKGYIERKSAPGRRASIVTLTPMGWRLLSATRKCAASIENQWASRIGKRRFSALRASLYELAISLRKAQPASENVKATADPKRGISSSARRLV
jgi:DNA-binding MarR family transcriptional regulator